MARQPAPKPRLADDDDVRVLSLQDRGQLLAMWAYALDDYYRDVLWHPPQALFQRISLHGWVWDPKVSDPWADSTKERKCVFARPDDGQPTPPAADTLEGVAEGEFMVSELQYPKHPSATR